MQPSKQTRSRVRGAHNVGGAKLPAVNLHAGQPSSPATTPATPPKEPSQAASQPTPQIETKTANLGTTTTTTSTTTAKSTTITATTTTTAAKTTTATATTTTAAKTATATTTTTASTTVHSARGLHIGRFIDIGINIKANPEHIIARARAADVYPLVLTGTSLSGSRTASRWATAFPGALLSTAGVHPHDAKTWDSRTKAGLMELLELPHVIAVGETGLDFNRNYSPQDQQVAAMREQLQLAREVGKPIFMHERDAFRTFSELLLEHKRAGGDLTKVCVHCFTGTADELKWYVAQGCSVGITGFVCDDGRAALVQDAIKQGCLPLERIMIETDSPFMMPRNVPNENKKALGRAQGKKSGSTAENEPCFLPYVVTKLAELYGCPHEVVQAHAIANTVAFFKL